MKRVMALAMVGFALQNVLAFQVDPRCSRAKGGLHLRSPERRRDR
jgi:hypothetical protein